eukprot:TRINITY_DN8809_c0_g1_i2.p2 TRINITY_DN8809_c0_g1~~TRINITY_DN8809_c0_g1_i2.p2  ORF type:complete len:443 (+),score=68.11 TRINITY_DN8809_c0_g1_i2:42-1331(+)
MRWLAARSLFLRTPITQKQRQFATLTAQKHAEKGASLSAAGRHQEALQHLQSAMDLGQNHLILHVLKAGCLWHLGRPDKAIDLAGALVAQCATIRSQPDVYASCKEEIDTIHAESLRIVGLCAQSQNDTGRALVAFEEATILQPEVHQGFLLLGSLLAKLPGREAEALRALERVAELQSEGPDAIRAHSLRSRIFCRLGDNPAALQSATTAVRASTQPQTEIQRLRAVCLGRAGLFEAAVEQWQEVLESSWTADASCHALLGACLHHFGNYAEATEHLLEATTSEDLGPVPHLSVPHVLLADCYEWLAKYPEALQQWDAALQAGADATAVRCRQAVLLQRLGETERANRSLGAIAGPRAAAIAEAMSLKEEGRLEEALERLDEATYGAEGSAIPLVLMRVDLLRMLGAHSEAERELTAASHGKGEVEEL